MNYYNQNNQVLLIICNTIIFISVLLIALIGIFYGAGDGQAGSNVIGLGYFKPFTMDSNIFAGITSFIMIIYGLRNIRLHIDLTPKWALTLQLMSTACLSLTFIIAALFLAPMNVLNGISYFVMFQDDMFFFHLINPIIAIFMFMFFNNKYEFNNKECIFGMIPTILYSIVYLFNVVIFKTWEDFYNFTFGGQYQFVPIVIIVIYLIVFLLSLILIKLHNINTVK